MKNLFLIIVFVLSYGCTPLSTNSQAFKNVQAGLLETNKTMNDIALKLDLLAEKTGNQNMPIVSEQTKELVKQIQEDNAKTYNAFLETVKGLMPVIKTGAEIAGNAVGIPSPVTKGVINVVDALLYGGASTSTIGAVATLWARRKDKKKFEDELKEWKDYDEENERKNQIKIRANALTSPNSTTEYQKNLVIAEKQLIEEGIIS